MFESWNNSLFIEIDKEFLFTLGVAWKWHDSVDGGEREVSEGDEAQRGHACKRETGME